MVAFLNVFHIFHLSLCRPVLGTQKKASCLQAGISNCLALAGSAAPMLSHRMESVLWNFNCFTYLTLAKQILTTPPLPPRAALHARASFVVRAMHVRENWPHVQWSQTTEYVFDLQRFWECMSMKAWTSVHCFKRSKQIKGLNFHFFFISTRYLLGQKRSLQIFGGNPLCQATKLHLNNT